MVRVSKAGASARGTLRLWSACRDAWRGAPRGKEPSDGQEEDSQASRQETARAPAPRAAAARIVAAPITGGVAHRERPGQEDRGGPPPAALPRKPAVGGVGPAARGPTPSGAPPTAAPVGRT